MSCNSSANIFVIPSRARFKDAPEGGVHRPDLLVADLETTVRDALRTDREVLATLLSTRRFYADAVQVC